MKSTGVKERVRRQTGCHGEGRSSAIPATLYDGKSQGKEDEGVGYFSSPDRRDRLLLVSLPKNAGKLE